VASKASQSERGLADMGRLLKESITHTETPEEAPRKDPATEAPPDIAPSTRLRERKKVVRRAKPKVTRDPQIAGDPYITGKEQYRIDVQQLMRLKIEYDVEKEHTESERATDYLLYDNYFDKALVTGTPGVNEENLLTGEEQAMYYWFYRKSYGFGYCCCPMGLTELEEKLKWSRSTVMKYLDSLVAKGVVTPLDEFKPYKNRRPQVYRVIFPRERLREDTNQHKVDMRRQYAQEALRGMRLNLGYSSEQS
jgi:hypothetical protein